MDVKSNDSAAGEAVFAAVDLGATSGRVITGLVGPGKLELAEAHRFANTPVRLPDGLRWDVLALYQGMLDGLRAVGRTGPVASIGIDTWAVDYGLLDGDGALLGLPFHYRDARNSGAAERLPDGCGVRELYAVSGLQHLPFNTVFQLLAHRTTAQWEAARTLLLMPDLLVHWLTGSVGAEITNASTTGLFDARSGDWSDALIGRLGLERALFPPLREPGAPHGDAAAARRRVHRPARRDPGDDGRLARHCVGGRGGSGHGGGLRVHLVRHLVAGRTRTGWSGAVRGVPGGQLHQ